MSVPWHIGCLILIIQALIHFGPVIYIGLAIIYLLSLINMYDKYGSWMVVFGLRKAEKK